MQGNYADIIELLMGRGVDANAFDPSSGETALHRAAWAGATRAAAALFAAGADLDRQDNVRRPGASAAPCISICFCALL